MEQKSYTKKELRVLMESTGYPMASIEKTMRLLELLRAINEDAFLSENLTLKGLYGDAESTSLIRKCIAYYLSLSRGVDIPQALEAIGRRPTQDFKKQLFPMLKTGYGFVDRDLMTSEAVKCVSRFIDFTENEHLYLEEARKGYYRPDLLFENESAVRIAENPAAKFYILNRA